MTQADGSTTTPGRSPLEGTDPRAQFAQSVALAEQVIEGTQRSQLHAPTPTDMDVRCLLEHLVMVLRRVACAGRGDDPWTWPIHAADVDDDGFADAWRAAARDVESVWSDDTLLARPTALPWGTFPGAETLGVYINEITVHTWDLAQATGQSPAWDDAVLAIADTTMHAQLPVADRTEMWKAFAASLPPDVPWEDPFGNAVDVPDNAPLIDRLVAWNGRRPPSTGPAEAA